MRLSDFDTAPENELPFNPTEPATGLQADSVAAGEAATIPTPAESQSVLKNRNFVTLWSGQIFSQLADKV